VELIYFDILPSPIGRILMGTTERGLRLLHYPLTKSPEGYLRRLDARAIRSRARTARVRKQLVEYFAGRRRRFDLPLDLRGTSFQLAVWRALQGIPYGRTASYGDLARQIGRPQAMRAVGTANHRNPIGIVVPCHRVIGSDGTLTGYAAGLDIKKNLLRFEAARVTCPSPRAAASPS